MFPDDFYPLRFRHGFFESGLQYLSEMGDHILGIHVGDGREIPEGLLLGEIITHSEPWHLDGQLLEFSLS